MQFILLEWVFLFGKFSGIAKLVWVIVKTNLGVCGLVSVAETVIYTKEEVTFEAGLTFIVGLLASVLFSPIGYNGFATVSVTAAILVANT